MTKGGVHVAETMTGILTDWGPAHAASFGAEYLKAHHTLHEHPLFSNESLAALLDTMPDDQMYINTSALNPERPADFHWVSRTGVSGAEVLEAVRVGRIWLNLYGAAEVAPEYGALIEQVYDELEAKTPGFHTEWRGGNVLISSPLIRVGYHADRCQNMLWHIRGTKMVRAYPLREPFIDDRNLERIFSLVADEALPFEMGFDDDAHTWELQPGEMITWPQNAPHRIDNLDVMNVSLSTEHYTRAAYRKEATYMANLYLRRRTHLPVRSTNSSSAWSAAKRFAYHKLQREAVSATKYDRTPTFRIDLEAPDCLRPI
jgi:hypothetical protein